jgi:cytochrome P450
MLDGSDFANVSLLIALRLHPVIPSNAREATHDTMLPCGGGEDGEAPLFVRKGTIVLYNVYSMHRDEAVFGRDIDEFVPERWEGLRPGWGYLPFNGGPRVCIGREFESTLALSHDIDDLQSNSPF